jgi:hypothetical protein
MPGARTKSRTHLGQAILSGAKISDADLSGNHAAIRISSKPELSLSKKSSTCSADLLLVRAEDCIARRELRLFDFLMETHPPSRIPTHPLAVGNVTNVLPPAFVGMLVRIIAPHHGGIRAGSRPNGEARKLDKGGLGRVGALPTHRLGFITNLSLTHHSLINYN